MTEYDVRRIPGDDDLSDAFDVRRDVFIEEQGVSEADEWDGEDETAIHYVVYDGDYPIGTARLRTPGENLAKIERVAVREPSRGQGIGRTLIRVLEDEAADQDCREVLLHAQTDVEAFYQKLGYETVSDVFVEDGIEHVKMRKRLD
jgi:predicted GNAT family N-acyltransferase